MALVVQKIPANSYWQKGNLITANKMNAIYNKINGIIDTLDTINNKAIEGSDNFFELSTQFNGVYENNTNGAAIKIIADKSDPSIITVTGFTGNQQILIPLNTAREITDKWLDISQSPYSCTCEVLDNGTSSTIINNENITLRQYNDSDSSIVNEYSNNTTTTWGNVLASIKSDYQGKWRHTQDNLQDVVTGKTGICLRLAPNIHLDENQYIKVQFIIVRGDYDGQTTTQIPIATALAKTSKDVIARDSVTNLSNTVTTLQSSLENLEEDLPEILSHINEVVIQDAVPTDENVKVWINHTSTSTIQIPTYQEFISTIESVNSNVTRMINQLTIEEGLNGLIINNGR